MNIILSDLHLGTNRCKINALSSLLEEIDGTFDKLILNGDILDINRLNKNWYFPSSHFKVINYFQRLYEKDKLVYIRGNHEETLKTLANIKIVDKYEYDSYGRKITLIHGHQLNKIRYPKFLENNLDELYYKFPENKILQALRNCSLNYMNKLPELASKAFPNSDFICIGHSHQPGFSFFDNVVVNSGDFVHNLSYIVESNGSIAIKYLDKFREYKTDNVFFTNV